jgi:hypothetical protein
MGDAPEGRHPRSELEDLVLRNAPDSHPVCGEPGAAVEQDRRHAAERAPFPHRLEPVEQLRHRDVESAGGRGERLGHGLHRPLGRANRGHVQLRQLDRLGLLVVQGLGHRGERVGALLHLEVHPDLEEAQRRQLAHRLGAGELLEHVERALEAQLRPRLGGDREPQVEVVVAQVVVRYARMRVHDLRRAPGMLRVDPRRHQHRLVAEHARVEDRGDLADDAFVQEAPGAHQHLVLAELGEAGDLGIGTLGEREASLQQVEQPLVGLVERDRRPVPTAARLGYRSQRATSLA